MNGTINVFAISHIGNSRDNQEDNSFANHLGCLPPDARDGMAENRTAYFLNETFSEDRFIFAVSDGMEVMRKLFLKCLG